MEVKAPGPVTQVWGTQHPRCPKQARGWLRGQEEAAQCWDLPSYGPRSHHKGFYPHLTFIIPSLTQGSQHRPLCPEPPRLRLQAFSPAQFSPLQNISPPPQFPAAPQDPPTTCDPDKGHDQEDPSGSFPKHLAAGSWAQVHFSCTNFPAEATPQAASTGKGFLWPLLTQSSSCSPHRSCAAFPSSRTTDKRPFIYFFQLPSLCMAQEVTGAPTQELSSLQGLQHQP